LKVAVAIAHVQDADLDRRLLGGDAGAIDFALDPARARGAGQQGNVDRFQATLLGVAQHPARRLHAHAAQRCRDLDGKVVAAAVIGQFEHGMPAACALAIEALLNVMLIGEITIAS